MQFILTKRSTEKELMDLGPNFYTQQEYEHCLKVLFKINKITGIYKETKHLLKKIPQNASLVDIGCGGGLFLLNLSNVYPKMRMLGIDISPAAISASQNELKQWKKTHPDLKVDFKLQTEHSLNLSNNSEDIILLTLVCHHLENEELILFLKKALDSVRIGIIINDLHRHIIAYSFYKLFSPLFRNRLIDHDGLISIKRGFTRNELIAVLEQADIKHYQIKWCFPFRWSVMIWKK